MGLQQQRRGLLVSRLLQVHHPDHLNAQMGSGLSVSFNKYTHHHSSPCPSDLHFKLLSISKVVSAEIKKEIYFGMVLAGQTLRGALWLRCKLTKRKENTLDRVDLAGEGRKSSIPQVFPKAEPRNNNNLRPHLPAVVILMMCNPFSLVEYFYLNLNSLNPDVLRYFE